MKNQIKPKLTLIFLHLMNAVLVAIILVIHVDLLATKSATIDISHTVVRQASPLTSKHAAIGISYGDTLVWDSPSVLSQTLDDAVAVGVTTIRVDLGWDDIQPDSANTYNWINFDRVVQVARSRKLTLLPVLAYTPPWARPLGCATPKCAPANPNMFASFAAAASKRYAPGIHTWEIWNEPNVIDFWQPTPNVSRYVNLLSVTSRAIRAADPQSFIVSAGLAPTDSSGGNIPKLAFFSAFVNQGGLSLVDAIGDHPYSYPVLPTYNADWNAWQNMANTTPSIESILKAHGAANKKIWITEYGAPTNGPGVGASPSNNSLGQNPDHADEALQAQMANDSVHLARSLSYIGALYWYSYKDLDTDKSDIQNFFGLRRFDDSPKPAWQSFQKAIATTN